MKLASLLTDEQIILDMKSEEHWEAIVELVNHLAASGQLPEDCREEVLEALRVREDQVSTGIGSGVAIPHTLNDRIDQVAAVFGRSVGGIDFEALDNAPVHFVVLFIVPRAQYNLHLQTLAAIAKTFANREIRQRLGDAESCREVLAVLSGEESKSNGPES